MNAKQIIDLGIAYDWEYDRDFIELIQKATQQENLSIYVIDHQNLNETLEKIKRDLLDFHILFDRASDTTPSFLEVQRLLLKKRTQVFESLEKLRWASDKATMHLEFITGGLYTPFTIILPSHDDVEDFELSIGDLAKLGRPFVIKPANTTGGGLGVVDGAETLQDVIKARKEYKTDKYLLQEKVRPLENDGERFWFRGFYAFSHVECCWWNDKTHNYRILSMEEIEKYRLQTVLKMIQKIAEISKLRFFSTEIALNQSRQLIVVDYVNESCDMRIQSRYSDGIPDEVVNRIVGAIVKFIKRQLAC